MHVRSKYPCLLVALFVATFVSCPVFAQNNAGHNNILTVAKTSDFTLSGKGDRENWNRTPWVSITPRSYTVLRKEQWNIPTDHKEGNNMTYKTQFKILYSEKGIYCLFQCEDSVITATIKEDYLNLYDEDVVEAFFWPDTSLPLYFEYELSPLNYELPILIVNNQGNIMGWRPWLYTGDRKIVHAVAINEKAMVKNQHSWTAEFFIPFTMFEPLNNAIPVKGTKWRANFYRIDYDNNPVYSSWQLTRKGYHDPERFGIIQFD